MRWMIATAAAGCVASMGIAREEPHGTLSKPVEFADRLLAETGSAADTARHWLRENLSDEAIAELESRVRGLLMERFDVALEEARRTHDATIGVFVFSPGSASVWQPAAQGVAPRHLVLLVHGLDEGGTIWDELAPALHAEGHVVARFNYPNDQPITISADLLAEALAELRTLGVGSVDIVAHSMGGLLARDVLTREAYYAGEARGGDEYPAIPRLIMIGTPHNGAPLAPLRGAMEVRDQIVRWIESDDKGLSHLLGFMVDGDGEAGADLCPQSAFLTDLNGRRPPEHVTMTCLIGEPTSCPRDGIRAALDSPFVRQVIGEGRAEAWKRETNGLLDEIGDGAVPCGSAILCGVEDVVVLPSNHRAMIKSIEAVESLRGAIGLGHAVPPAIPVILDRLRR